MPLEEKIVGQVAIVKVTGDITLNTGGHELLKDKVNSLLQQGYTSILVDLGGVSFVDSTGLGVLVQSYVTTRNKGGALKLVNVARRLNDLLVVTRLVTVFETFDSEAKALASFGAPAGR